MRILLLGCAAALALSACDRFPRGPSADSASATSAESALPPGHVPITPGGAPLSGVGQVLLDSGNVAFRQKDFAAAQAYYQKAAEAAPGHAAPWFGTYMVGQATGNKALADSALRMVRQRAPDMQAHPEGAPGAAPGGAPGGAPGAAPTPPRGGPPPLPHGSPPPVKRTAPVRSS